MKRSTITVATFSAVSFLCVPGVRADLIGFENITGNSSLSATAGEAQLYADVALSPSDPSLVRFCLFNDGPVASVIKSVHFDDALGLLGDLIDVSGSGVQFSLDDGPVNLPGGNPVGFDTDFSLSADSPAPKWGLNPGDVLYLTFGLAADANLAAVQAALASDELRIGMHVIAYPNGRSESFVSSFHTQPQQVTEPGLLAFMGLGLLGLAAWRRAQA